MLTAPHTDSARSRDHPAAPATLALCVPAFNAATFLHRLSDSVRAQHRPFDELWLYDDASTDHTATLAQSLGFTVLRDEINAGPAVGRNRLAARSHCTWLHFHDADDALAPEFTTLAHAWIARLTPPEVVLFDFETRDDATGVFNDIRRFDAAALAADPLAYALREQINAICGLYRRDAFLAAGGFDEDPRLRYHEDPALHVRLALARQRFGVEPTVAITNFTRANSTSALNRLGCFRSRHHMLLKALAAVPPTHRALAAEQLWRNATLLASHRDWPHVREAVRHARAAGLWCATWERPLLRALSIVAPFTTLYLREHLIRLLRPHLRSLNQ